MSNATLKSRAREMLSQKYKRRGNVCSNIWLYYSPKTCRDWVVTSDPECDLAYWLEARPDVVRFDLAPEPIVVKVGNDNHKTEFDALVWFADRKPAAIEIKYEAEEINPTNVRTIHQREAQVIAAEQLGAERLLVTDQDLQTHEKLIANWRRVVPYMAATRSYPMGEFNEWAATKLYVLGEGTLGELLTDVPKDQQPMFLSAVFSLHQRGLYATDLDTKPLSTNTRIWRAEGGEA